VARGRLGDGGLEYFTLTGRGLLGGTVGDPLKLDRPVTGIEQSNPKGFAIEAAHFGADTAVNPVLVIEGFLNERILVECPKSSIQLPEERKITGRLMQSGRRGS
jgi:hypothetical protein